MKKALRAFFIFLFSLCLTFNGVNANQYNEENIKSDLNVEVTNISNEEFNQSDSINEELSPGSIAGSKTAQRVQEENQNEEDADSREVNVEISIDAEGFSESSVTYEYLDIALIIDNSGSMKNNKTTIKVVDEDGITHTKTVTRLEAAKTASLELVKSLMSKNTEDKTYFRVSLSIFNDHGRVSKELTGTYSEIEKSINEMTAGSGTNVQSGINNGATTLYGQGNDKVIILLSDGETNESDGIKNNNTYTYKDDEHEIEYTYQKESGKTDFNAAKAAADFFKNDENYNITFYTIGFGTNENANELLKYISLSDDELDANGNETYSRFLTANDGEELLAAFQKIVEVLTPRTDIASDAVLKDTVPTDFILSEEEKENLRNTYGEKIVSFKDTENGTEITYNIGDINSNEKIVFKYKITAKDEYHGSMYTNNMAYIEAIPSKGNPYKYVLDNKTGAFTVELTKPSVLIPAITHNDEVGSVKSNGSKIIEISSILSNDNNSHFEEGTQTENIIFLQDTIEIVDLPKNGTLILNEDKKSYLYKPTVLDEISDSFTYRVITKSIIGYDDENKPIYETVKSNISSVSINIEIVYGNVIVKHVEKDNYTNIISIDEPLFGQIGSEYKTSFKKIDNWLFTNIIPLNKEGKFEENDITVYYEYTKEMGSLIVNYVDINGKELLPSKVMQEQAGTEYKTEKMEIDKYVLSSVEGNEIGTYTNGKTEVNYIYEKEDTDINEIVDTGINQKLNIEYLSIFIFISLIKFIFFKRTR